MEQDKQKASKFNALPPPPNNHPSINVGTSYKDSEVQVQAPSHVTSLVGSATQNGPYASDLLLSFNPTAEIRQGTIPNIQSNTEEQPRSTGELLANKYRNFNLESGKSSEEFLRQMQELNNPTLGPCSANNYFTGYLHSDIGSGMGAITAMKAPRKPPPSRRQQLEGHLAHMPTN